MFNSTRIPYKELIRIVSNDTPGPTPAPEDTLGSNSNDDEDESEWLRARGINCVYDHWPSESRKKIARSITKACADIEVRCFAYSRDIADRADCEIEISIGQP